MPQGRERIEFLCTEVSETNAWCKDLETIQETWGVMWGSNFPFEQKAAMDLICLTR